MMKHLTIMALLVFSLLSPAPGEAAELPADRALAFADHLFAQGDYYRAITEYERFLFYYPEAAEARTAEYQIALAYQKGEKWSQAIERFRALADRSGFGALRAKVLFQLGETRYLKKDYNLALDAYDEFLRSYPEDPDAGRAHIRRGICYLQLRDWPLAAAEFERLPEGSPEGGLSLQLVSETGKTPEIETKSPAWAASLSAVLPGAGQLYVGRPTDALTSFLLNGLFIWGAVEAFDNGNHVTAGMLTAFESAWYVGNIYNAASSAHKYNRHKEQEFIERLQGDFGISCLRDGQGHNLLALTMHF